MILQSTYRILAGLVLLLAALPAMALESGQVVGRHIYGLARDYQNAPVLLEGNALIYPASNYEKLFTKNDQAFQISLFEHLIGGIYVTEYDSKEKQYIDTVALNLSSVSGLSRPAGAIESRWDTSLFSENIAVDAARPDAFVQQFKAYFNHNPEMVNPYDYGWISEAIVLNAGGDAKLIKNYAVGRVAASHLVLMPDAKTLYMLDQQHSGNLYMFVAETPNSLAKGTLYYFDPHNGYVKLGERSSLRMKFKLKKSGFGDFFDFAAIEGGECPASFNQIVTLYGLECLKIRNKNKQYSGLFEPIRVAALNGYYGLYKHLDRIDFDETSQQLVFISQDQHKTSIQLVADEALGTAYSLEVSP